MPVGKIIIMAAEIPVLPERQLALFCRHCEAMLAGSLAYGQLEHLRAFPLGGEPLKARTSRVLARLLALRFLPAGVLIDMDRAKPVIVGDDRFCLAFSHCEGLAFAALAKKNSPEENFCMAIDAEACPDEIKLKSIKNFLARLCHSTQITQWMEAIRRRDILRFWLLYECAIKFSVPDIRQFLIAASACGGFPHKGGFLHENMIINWRIVCFADYLICVLCTGSGMPEIESILYRPAPGATVHA